MRFLFILSLCLSGVSASWANPGVSTLTWEKIDESDGVLVFKQEVPGSDVIAFKGEGVINAPILRVGSVLVDVPRVPEWMDSVVEARTLRKASETEYIEYDHIETPIVLKDRDFVTSNRLEVDVSAKQIRIITRSVEEPLAPKTSFVRGTILSGRWVLTSIDGGQRTHMLTELHTDPNGSVPKWIVNLFQRGWAKNTIESLRKQVAKSDIQIHPQLKLELEKRGFPL